jgi:hypothetical protein
MPVAAKATGLIVVQLEIDQYTPLRVRAQIAIFLSQGGLTGVERQEEEGS